MSALISSRYIGRVGALAVALGIGSAIGAMPIALADTTGSPGAAGTSADSSSQFDRVTDEAGRDRSAVSDHSHCRFQACVGRHPAAAQRQLSGLGSAKPRLLSPSHRDPPPLRCPPRRWPLPGGRSGG